MSSEPVNTDIEFDAWRDSLPATHWSKYDLAACRLGWDAAKAVRATTAEAKLKEAAKVLERVTEAAITLIDAAPTRLGCGIHCQAEIEHMEEEAYSAAYGNLDFLLPSTKAFLANLKGAE